MVGGTIPRVNPQVILREEFDDFSVLFDPDTGDGYGLNRVGVFIWKLLDGTNDLQTIKQKVSESFQHASDDVDNEVEQFLGDLVENGLVGYET